MLTHLFLYFTYLKHTTHDIKLNPSLFARYLIYLFIYLLKRGTWYTIIKTVTYEQDNKAVINSTNSCPIFKLLLHFKKH